MPGTTLAEFAREIAGQAKAETRGAGHDKLTDMFAQRVAALIPDKAKILDVGCGHGPALEWFSKRNHEILGISMNREDVSYCLSREHCCALCDQNDLERFEDDALDLVWARHVLEHSIAPFYTLHEFYRILKDGAILYVEVPAPCTQCLHETNLNHFSVFGYEMWLNLFSRLKFKIVEACQTDLKTCEGLQDIYYSFILRK